MNQDPLMLVLISKTIIEKTEPDTGLLTQPGPRVSQARRQGQPGRPTGHWLCHFLAVWLVQASPTSPGLSFPICIEQVPEQVISQVTSSSGFHETLHLAASCQALFFPAGGFPRDCSVSASCLWIPCSSAPTPL